MILMLCVSFAYSKRLCLFVSFSLAKLIEINLKVSVYHDLIICSLNQALILYCLRKSKKKRSFFFSFDSPYPVLSSSLLLLKAKR